MNVSNGPFPLSPYGAWFEHAATDLTAAKSPELPDGKGGNHLLFSDPLGSGQPENLQRLANTL
jgi:hypothetical protein